MEMYKIMLLSMGLITGYLYTAQDAKSNNEDETKVSLLEAVQYCTLDEVKRLIQEGADLNETDSNGNTPLICSESAAITTELLKNPQVNVHTKNNHGMTALSYAAIKGHDQIVKILLQHGAIAHHTDHEGHSALEHGQFRSSPKVAILLLDAMDDKHNIVECSKVALSSHPYLQAPYKKPVVQKLQSILFDRSIAFLAFQHLADKHYQPSDASSSSSSSAKSELIRHPGELLLIPKLMLTSNVLRQLPNGITPSALMPVLEKKESNQTLRLNEKKSSLYECLTPLILGEQPKPSSTSCPSKSEVHDSEDDACNGPAAAGK